MSILRSTLGCVVCCLLAVWQAQAQPLYYNTSSPATAQNTLNSVATNGTSHIILLTASGIDFNHVNRCTAMAVDGLNGKLFFLDGLTSALWVTNLNGSGLTEIKAGLTNYPTDLALDVLNEQVYLSTSSTVQTNNTIQRIDYTGNNYGNLFIATGAGGNGVSRCTAIALDVAHGKIFIADAGTKKIWSMSLTGTGLTALAAGTNGVPTDLALDTTNQQVYFTLSSPILSSNRIQRVSYSGTGFTTVFSASNGVQRCTSLALDLAHSMIYLSDAGSNTPALWRLPLAGGTAVSVSSGLAAPAKKVAWYSGITNRPPPKVTGFRLAAGTNVVVNATNGFVGGTYYILTSTNLATSLGQWSKVSTNILGATGPFAITATNGASANSRQRFFILQVQ